VNILYTYTLCQSSTNSQDNSVLNDNMLLLSLLQIDQSKTTNEWQKSALATIARYHYTCLDIGTNKNIEKEAYKYLQAYVVEVYFSDIRWW
jgi:hypothetical protein